jgi:hypothetical protein
MTQERRLLALADPAHELHQRITEQRTDHRLEIILADPIDLGRDLEGYTRSPGDLDRPIGPLFGADAAQESEILGRERREVQGRNFGMAPRTGCRVCCEARLAAPIAWVVYQTMESSATPLSRSSQPPERSMSVRRG